MIDSVITFAKIRVGNKQPLLGGISVPEYCMLEILNGQKSSRIELTKKSSGNTAFFFLLIFSPLFLSNVIIGYYRIFVNPSLGPYNDVCAFVAFHSYLMISYVDDYLFS